ncbi:hypothetical protein HOL34_02575 [bacterium]|nr:hypothetical protein [bacterium]
MLVAVGGIQNIVDQSTASTATMAATYNVSDNAKLDLVGNPSQASHSVYGMANYRWNDNEWAPYVGFGGKGEFSASNNANKKGVLNIWSVMVQGGLHF